MTEEKNISEIYAALPGLLLPWYDRCKRPLPWRRDKEPYHVWISEIMLQQTRVEAAWDYYLRFLEALPTVQDLAAAPEEKLMKLWEGLGYYSRVRNLQKAARMIVEEMDGHFPGTHAGIRRLPGIGPYTAGAISSICFELPTAAVDGNVLRIITRITGDHTPIDSVPLRDKIGRELEKVYLAGKCGDFTQALMELGAMICLPQTPKCEHCPVKNVCVARREGLTQVLPVKKPKKEKREEDMTVFLLRCGDKIALCRREEKGVLHGMWQLPNTPKALTEEEALQWAEKQGVKPRKIIKWGDKTHIFTHIRWNMCCWEAECGEMADRFAWLSEEQVRREVSLPTAFRTFIE